MNSMEQPGNESAKTWWPVIFVFAILAALLIFVFYSARPPVDPQPAATANGHDSTAPVKVTMEKFLEALAVFEPRVEIMTMDCPIDGTPLEAPNIASRQSTNVFGGVSTDLMSIALGPPTDENGRPSIEKQEWEMLVVTNPNNGATYHALDIFNFTRPGAPYAIDPADWDLALIAPPLAARDTADWTYDEQVLMRVLTQRAFGVDDIELGFSALQGAYAANFGTWYGKEVHIPSVAFYALAAAYLAKGIEESPALNETARGIATMTKGECYRLLGRQAAAAEAFKLVHDSGSLNSEDDAVQSAVEVLEQIQDLNESGNFALDRAAHGGFAAPPTGWYILEMLPAMNGHIDQHRAEWAALDDPDEILAKIIELIP